MRSTWILTALLVMQGTVLAHAADMPGVTATEIKIGNTMPYSGPVSAFGTVGKGDAAFFKMINDQGGINGRKINFISYDDAYSPPKTVEQTRKLVESDEVAFIFNPMGTAPNLAIQRYLNQRKVPALFISTGATRFGDPKNFPWTMPFQPAYQNESRIYARYIMETFPNAKIGVLYQNDDLGRDLLKGLVDGLGEKKSMIVQEASYDINEPTIDSQIVKLRAAGADVFMNFSTAKFAAQAIKKNAEIGWKPVHFLAYSSSSVGAVLQPAGFENAKDIMTVAFYKDPTDPTWKDDPGMTAWRTFMEKYYPDGDRTNSFNVFPYMVGQVLVQVLKQCGDDLSRENIMRQAASIKDFEVDVLLPGIRVNTGPTDYFPIEQTQLMRFDGERWNLFGSVITGEIRSD